MVTTWIVVSDASRARVLSVRGDGQWKLVRELSHPASRSHGHELVSDRQGRVQQSANPARSAMEPPTPPKEVEADHFAQLLGELLRHGLAAQEYAQLVLVAPPHFLGRMREHLGAQVAKHVAASVDKDLTAFSVRELTASLHDVVAPLTREPR